MSEPQVIRITHDDIRNAIATDLEEKISLAELNIYIVTHGFPPCDCPDAYDRLTAQLHKDLGRLRTRRSYIDMDEVQIRRRCQPGGPVQLPTTTRVFYDYESDKEKEEEEEDEEGRH